MLVLVDLKGRPLKATACGQCSGSSSDSRTRERYNSPSETQGEKVKGATGI